MSSGAAIKIGTSNGLAFSSGAVTQSGSPTAAIKAYTLKDKEIEAADLNGSRGSFSFFNFFTSSATAEQLSKNEEVSVANAAFKIETNSANQVEGAFSYAVTTVDNIRFQPKAAEAK